MRRRTIVLVAGAMLAGAVQTRHASTGDGARAACTGAEYRAFDFWIGEWRVTTDGAVAGTNRIEPVLGGCALVETWQGARGGQGRSLNAYDSARHVWHQTWVDGHGEVLVLEGGWRDGRMQLAGAQPSRTGGQVRQRITWTPNADGTVRQLWESSTDDGRSWSVAFDGVYVLTAPAR